MLLDIEHSEDSKNLGVAYYTDCYKFWDLGRCREEFEGDEYRRLMQNLKAGKHALFSTQNPTSPSLSDRLIKGLKNFKRSILKPSSSITSAPNEAILAVIDFKKYKSFEDYYSALPKNVQRDVDISKGKRYSFKEFSFDQFIPDFCEINKSQLKRLETINPWYTQPPDFFRYNGPAATSWENHYFKWYGVFRYLKNYRQDGQITNERLLAYCQVAVDGEMASVCLFWGNTDYYKDGIMFHIITSVVEDLMKNPKIRCLVYYWMDQYPEWKKRMLFEPNSISLRL